MEDRFICRFCGSERKNKNSLTNHERLCKSNPNRQEPNRGGHGKNGGLNQFSKAKLLGLPVPKPGTYNKPGTFLGKHHSDESKIKISSSMKAAHSKGIAHVWQHRMTEPSYPEQFMISVLKNEFNLECGVDYFREVPFHGYFLDFCFTERKIVIEMDGEQHTRFSDQIERDKRKDALLKDEGYTELRIPWKDCFNNPREWIDKVASLLGIINYAEVT